VTTSDLGDFVPGKTYVSDFGRLYPMATGYRPNQNSISKTTVPSFSKRPDVANIAF